MSKNSTYARGHKETSTTGKWDPGGYNLDTMRADTADRLGQPSGGGGGDYTGDVVASAQDVWTIKPWSSSDPVSTASALQRVFQMMMEMDTDVDNKVWTAKPWSSSDPVSTASALQRVFQMCEDMQADIKAIKNHLEL